MCVAWSRPGTGPFFGNLRAEVEVMLPTRVSYPGTHSMYSRSTGTFSFRGCLTYVFIRYFHFLFSCVNWFFPIFFFYFSDQILVYVEIAYLRFQKTFGPLCRHAHGHIDRASASQEIFSSPIVHAFRLILPFHLFRLPIWQSLLKKRRNVLSKGVITSSHNAWYR